MNEIPFVFVPHIYFEKAEVAYCHRRLASYISTWCSCTLQSYSCRLFVRAIICKFRLHLSLNCMEDVAELLVHV